MKTNLARSGVRVRGLIGGPSYPLSRNMNEEKEVSDMRSWGHSECKGPEVGRRLMHLRRRRSPVWLGEQGEGGRRWGCRGR